MLGSVDNSDWISRTILMENGLFTDYFNNEINIEVENI